MLEPADYITLAEIFRKSANTSHAGQFASNVAREFLKKAGIIEEPKWYEVTLTDEIRKRIHDTVYVVDDKALTCKFCLAQNKHEPTCPMLGLADTVSNVDEFIEKVSQMLKDKTNGADTPGGASQI